MEWCLFLIGSSVGKKMLMAFIGLCMIGFLVVHLLGNSLAVVGADAFNDYAGESAINIASNQNW